MFDDVIERLLDNQKEIVAHFGGENYFGQKLRHFQAAGDLGRLQILLGKAAGVS